MNQSYSLLSLPNSVLLKIPEYLSLHDIILHYGLTCKLIFKLIPQIKLNLLKSFIPLEVKNQIQSYDINAILKSRKYCSKQMELPFWGVKTNGDLLLGIAYDNTKFWIAKAFLKSKSSQVACRLKTPGTYIEGTLAKDVYEFKNKIVGMSYLISKIMNKELVYHYHHQSLLRKKETQNYLEYPLVKLQHWPSQYTLKALMEIIRWIKICMTSSYSMDKIYFTISKPYMRISKSVQNRTFTILTTRTIKSMPIIIFQISRIQNQLSFPKSLEINRKTNLSYIPRTLIVYTSKNNNFPDNIAPYMLKCKMELDLAQFIQNQSHINPIDENITYNICRTNSLPLSQFASQFDSKGGKIDDCVKEEFQFYNFMIGQQTNQAIQPLVWLRFPKFNQSKEKTYKFNLKMIDEESVLSKSIQVKFLDIEKAQYNDDDERYDGLGIGYIRLKGMMIDQETMNFVSE